MTAKSGLDNDIVNLEIQDGIVICTYKPGEVGLEKAKHVVRDRLELCDGKSYPGIVVDNGVTKISKEAREYFGSEEGIQGISAAAIVTNKPIGNMIVNFLVRIQKPAIPVKTFTDLESAKMWLKQYI